MVAVFANIPIQATVVAVQVGKIYFDAPCKYCRDGRHAPRMFGRPTTSDARRPT